MLELIEANRDDARELAMFAARTFRDTYAAFNDAANVDEYVATHFSEAHQRAELADTKMHTLLLRDDDALVGYAQLRDARPPVPLAGTPIEISRFYVDRARHGSGVAQTLMNGLLAFARERGAELIWLGVWENNPRAISFYRRNDFSDVGVQTFTMGSDVQRDLVMARRL